MGEAYFDGYKRDYFSQEFILFIDTEFFPGLDYLVQHIGDRKIKNVSATSSPEYRDGQLYYTCARLWYRDGSVKNIWFPWYSFQTQFGRGHISRNSPSEKCMPKCLYNVFQHMLDTAQKVISLGGVDIRLPVCFFT